MVKDMTQGSPMRHLLSFSIPLLIGNIFQQLYNFTDAAIVGRTMGHQALAAVGSVGSLLFLVFGFYFGLTGGLAVITGQRFGAGDMDGVRKSVAASTIICIVFSILSTTGCLLLANPILRLMKTPPDIFADALVYIRTMFWGLTAIIFYSMVSSVLRSLGDSRTPLIFLVLTCVLNIGLDLLFILVFKMGVLGAGIATVIAQALCVVLCIISMLRRMPLLRLDRSSWQLSRRIFYQHLRVGLPMGLQFAITAVGIVVFQAAMNNYGSEVIAACSAVTRIDSIAIQPIFSFGMATAAYTAQNFGAGKLERVHRGTIECLKISLSYSMPLGVLLVIFTPQLVGLFLSSPTPAIVSAARTMITVGACFYWVLVMLLIYRNVLQGMGYTTSPLAAGFAELVARVAASFTLGAVGGYTALCFTHPLAWMSAVVILFPTYLVVMKKLRSASAAIPAGIVE